MSEEITTTTVQRIQALAAELETLGKTALGKAVEAGNLLRECKASLAHGGWLPWLEANFTFADRTARRWMKLAEDVEAGRLKTDTVSNLAEAYRITTEPTAEENDQRPETFAELEESQKDACRIWWNYCAAEVLARHAMGIPAKEIAVHTGRSLDEVERIIRPRFIPWDSYKWDEIKVPPELYDSARKNLVACLMQIPPRSAAFRLDRLKDTAAKESARRKLLAKAEYYDEEYRTTSDCTAFHFQQEGVEMARRNDKQIAVGHFLYNTGEIAILDARHACGIQAYDGIGNSLLILPLLALWPTNHGLSDKEFTLLIKDTKAFREHMESKEKGDAAP